MPFTRRQSRMASAGTPTPASPAMQHANATALPSMTPKGKSALSFLTSITHRQPKTPKDKSPIKPAELEMHPQRDHRTSTTPYDEARWLGFFNMGPQTAPAAKTTSFTAAETSPTPTKFVAPSTLPHTTSPITSKTVASPGFQFTFRRAPSVELSEDAQKIMEESRVEAAKIRAQLASLPTVPDTEPEETMNAPGRKIAKPKGKAGRFSDVHKESFKKLDSIANHASAWRVDPNRKVPGPAATALKRSPSKAELDKTLPVPSLKRSPSKAELNKPVTHALQRSPSKPALKKVEVNPFLTRSPSKLGLNKQELEERPQPSAKRVKHFREEDAGIARPKDDSPATSTTTTPRRQTQGLVRSKSGLLRPGFTSAMSPTKSSMARTQNPKDNKLTTQIPALVRSTTIGNLRQAAATSALPRSKSMRDLIVASTPSTAAPAVSVTAPSPSPIKVSYLPLKSPVKPPTEHDISMIDSPSSAGTPKRIKSILRTPNRRYTRDPLKIAAGTHLATPPPKIELYPNIPNTEPVVKRVDFTNSTKEKADRDAAAAKAASVEPESVAYPDLPATQDFNRRTTMAAMPTIPGAFTFTSDRQISFGSPKTATIRQVRTSDAGLPPAFQFTCARDPSSPSKRKLDTLDETGETSEKENQDEDEHRPAKKARVFSSAKSVPTTPVAKKVQPASMLPRFGSARRPGGLTAARLTMLAKPKKRV